MEGCEYAIEGADRSQRIQNSVSLGLLMMILYWLVDIAL